MRTIYYGKTASGKSTLSKRLADEKNLIHCGEIKTSVDTQKFQKLSHCVAEVYAGCEDHAYEILLTLGLHKSVLDSVQFVQASYRNPTIPNIISN